jgi:SAM-dependent methyltransferase
MSAATDYAARVDAVLAQRTRLRGPQPIDDLFAGLPPQHPLLVSDPRRALDSNLEVLASYLEPDDVIVDVGGGAGRTSLPLALRCREVIDVDPSAAMLKGFAANAAQAGITNVRAVQSAWPAADPPRGTVALVNHVTYLTRDIVPFLEALNRAASRRVLLTVNDPPPPSRNSKLFPLVYGEPEELVPGHAELTSVLREMGIAPETRALANPTGGVVQTAPTRDAALQMGLTGFAGHQWAFWPLGDELTARVRQLLESRFDELFVQRDGGYAPGWTTPGHEVLLTWTPP